VEYLLGIRLWNNPIYDAEDLQKDFRVKPLKLPEYLPYSW